jgi:hypothetical protein
LEIQLDVCILQWSEVLLGHRTSDTSELRFESGSAILCRILILFKFSLRKVVILALHEVKTVSLEGVLSLVSQIVNKFVTRDSSH